MLWNEQVCLITGATGGIGSALAQQLSNLGAKLILHGRQEDKLTALLNELGGKGHEVVCADINTTAGLQAIETKVRTVGKLTMLINNAGKSGFSMFEHCDMEQISAVITTNLLAVMTLSKTLLPMLKQHKQSYLINIGSVYGAIGYPSQAVYCASKFGLRGFSESLYRELSSTSVKVMYLAPRATDTQINQGNAASLNKALGNKVDTPDVVVNALIKQIQQQRPRQTLGWPERLFVKLNAIVPWLVDSALIKQLPIIKHYANFAVTEAK